MDRKKTLVALSCFVLVLAAFYLPASSPVATAGVHDPQVTNWLRPNSATNIAPAGLIICLPFPGLGIVCG